FIAFGTHWAIPYALPLSIFLCLFEFMLGCHVILNIRIKLVSWLVLLMMSFFTILTFNDAINNPVPDCGCFGDAIKLTNWETFYKNIVLMLFVIIYFTGRNIKTTFLTIKSEIIIVSSIIILFTGFEIYNYRHLPVIDFSTWKPGTKLVPDNLKPLQFFVTYKNKKTGVSKEYLSSNYPYNDSIWLSEWEYTSQRVVDPNPKRTDIILEDINGNVVTEDLLRHSDYLFIIVSYDLEQLNSFMVNKIIELHNKIAIDGHKMVFFTSNTLEIIEKFKQNYQINENIEFFYADDTSLQAIIRCNPGLILTKEAIVIKKWHYNDFPDSEKLNKFLKKQVANQQ
ncbi:MAG: hypothetical protein KA792_10305, partial [Bacteroidales bacterium]|nr:hypothetical protein [Bacteroidales bacterium]